MNKNYLLSNAFFMMAYTVSSTGLNAVYWWLAARLYLPEMVGLAVVLISMAQLLTTTANLGMSYGLIRFFQNTEEKGKLLSTVLTVCLLLASGFGMLTIFVGPRISTSLTILNNNIVAALFFLGLTIFLALFQLSYPILVALNKTSFYVFLNMFVLGSRILLLLVGKGNESSLTLFIAFVIPVILADLFILVLYLPRNVPGYSIWPYIDGAIWEKFRGYSISSYIGNLLHDLPYQIVPQVVANFSGFASTAYFYFPWTLFGLLTNVSSTLSYSLFVEGANRPDSFERNKGKVLAISLGIAVIGIIFFFIAGQQLLGLFGPDYSLGLPILKVLCISVVPAAIVYNRVAILRVRNNTNGIIFIYSLILILCAVFIYLVPIEKNVLWIGWCWFIAHAIAAFVIWFLGGRKHEKRV